MSENKEVHEYQAEMQKILDILAHSLYTEREIFLRELISNASDALSKMQFMALTTEDVLEKDCELEIKISFDDKEKTVIVTDTGIGMTRQEIIDNIGKIASSGTLQFLKTLKEDQDKANNLIGQFGVGFYSVFMVAKKVVLETRSFLEDEQGWQWSSQGSGQYELRPLEMSNRGTTIKVFLKDDAHEFCSDFRLETIIKKYSDYIPFPVILKDKTVNRVKALWTLAKSEIEQSDYDEFYKQLSHDYRAPFFSQHLSIDAPIQYFALLFIPEEVGNEVLYARESTGINLYAQRVFIQSENKNLLPPFLRFVRGVVDSEDLPLNVSRESIHHNALLEKIKKSLVSRFLKELRNLAESNVEKYNQFWKRFGIFLKEGVSGEYSNREKLVELLRFNSSIFETAEEITSLEDVQKRIREEQKEIYYVIGPSRDAILHNPNLEYFKENGLEVLYLYDHVDDFLMMELREYQGKPLKSISQADINVEEKNNTHDEFSKDEAKTIIEYIKAQLGDRVADVIQSKRLVGSPCSLINPKDSMSSHMEKMMKAVNKDFEISKRNLEINPNHALIQNMARLLKKDKDSPFLKEYVEQLFNNVLLVEGLLDNPLELLPRMYRFMEDASQFHLDR